MARPKGCPHCLSTSIMHAGTAFLEAGEYDEAREEFEREHDVEEYQCEGCGKSFWV